MSWEGFFYRCFVFSSFRYLVRKLRQKRFFGGSEIQTPIEEAREILANTILAHVPVSRVFFLVITSSYYFQRLRRFEIVFERRLKKNLIIT